MSKDDIEKKLTENPLLDEIVYNCKQILADGVVLKDQQEADELETYDTIRYSDIYLACIDNCVSFGMFQYSSELISTIPSISNEKVKEYAMYNDRIPKVYRPLLLNKVKQFYIDNYEEENNYYRRLAGLPDIGDEGMDVDIDSIPENMIAFVDTSKKLHEQNEEVIQALEASGYLDDLYEENKDKKYIRHLGKRKISIYNSRKGSKFSTLYVGECDAPEVKSRFTELLNLNENIFLRSYYDEAYAYKSDYYDKFIIMMILLQTVTDCITDMPEYIIRKDVFDVRTIQYMFESSGVRYFPDIPLRYQVSLVKNLNRLIKYKSTDKCLVDIVSLFGFDNIDVFKYYMIRDRNVDPDGNYVDSKNPQIKYDLKFIKVPIGGLVDDHIKDSTNILDYDTTVEQDKYWDSDYDHSEVKTRIIEHEFNIIRSKYYSINSIYSMQQYTFQMTYFLNILFNNDLDKEMLNIYIPYINCSGNIVDLFVFMYALTHVYYGTEDIIIDKPDKALKILGFNFDADMAELSDYVSNSLTTLEELGVSDFIKPEKGIFTFNQLMYIYTQNKSIYDYVVHEMITANNYRIYSIYKKIYESLMLTDINQKYFTLEDGTLAHSYAEFLKYKNPALYAVYEKHINTTDDIETRNKNISTCVYNVATVLEEYLDMNALPYIFAGLPAASIESVKQYAMDVINFFKSFKVTVMDINTVYKLDDKLENRIKMIDDWILTSEFCKKEIFPYEDKICGIKETRVQKSKYDLIEKLYKYWEVYRKYPDVYTMKDMIAGITDIYELPDKIDYYDIIFRLDYVYDKYENYRLLDNINTKSIYDVQERYYPIESLEIRYFYE